MNRPYEHSRSAGSRRQERRSRSRSRSSRSSSSSSSDDERYQDRPQRRDRRSDDDDKELAAPKPPSFPKTSFGLKATSAETRLPTLNTSRFQAPSAKVLPVQMKLATKSETIKKISVAAAFSNNDSDDEIEEMPAECRMRMRNIGRDTPTSSGPNSFGKTKQGFCDAKKMFEKNLKEPAGANKD